MKCLHLNPCASLYIQFTSLYSLFTSISTPKVTDDTGEEDAAAANGKLGGEAESADGAGSFLVDPNLDV